MICTDSDCFNCKHTDCINTKTPPEGVKPGRPRAAKPGPRTDYWRKYYAENRERVRARQNALNASRRVGKHNDVV